MNDTFKDHPESVTEVRAKRSNNAAHATPRDALICVLRDLDAGEIKPEALVVAWRGPVVDGKTETGWDCASPDVITSLGLLAGASARIASDGEGD
jgi:hypothetical protein